ncbi:MAG: hypothetical protein CENE_00635 [Candidatus Celerinatantimonas neptuna]|nr:MAG: hypothetical protein CENE_00635 [Candidatus Celerinatantimonas neptuna]
MRCHICRLFLVIIGWVSIGLGLLGFVLPLLPTTPFILLAGVCFSKASPRFELWLLNHRVFGPVISNWRQYHMIPWHVKWLAVFMLVISAIGIGFSQLPLYGKSIIWGGLLILILFIVTRRSRIC